VLKATDVHEATPTHTVPNGKNDSLIGSDTRGSHDLPSCDINGSDDCQRNQIQPPPHLPIPASPGQPPRTFQPGFTTHHAFPNTTPPSPLPLQLPRRLPRPLLLPAHKTTIHNHLHNNTTPVTLLSALTPPHYHPAKIPQSPHHIRPLGPALPAALALAGYEPGVYVYYG
jgi:hypothetical protein